MDDSGSKTSEWADYVLKGKRSSKPRSNPNADSERLLSRDRDDLENIPTIPDSDDIEVSPDDNDVRQMSGDVNRTNMYQEINKELKKTSTSSSKAENISILMEKFTPEEFLKKFDENSSPWSIESLLAEFSDDYYATHGVHA